jgi:hypothetical protein
MLFQALTGRLPFSGSIDQILHAKLHREPPAPFSTVPGAPKDLERLCAQLLRRDPAKRPDTAGIFYCLGVSAEPALLTSIPSESVFVGRHQELDVLKRAFESVKHGRTVRVNVYGESGVGKTAFVQHFLTSLRKEERCLVLAGRCYEQEFARYQALDSVVDALSRYLISLPPSELNAILPSGAFLLARLFPVLQPIVPRAQEWPEPPDPREIRKQAFASMRKLFANLGRSKPLVVFIDDVHWSDADSGPLIAEILHPPDPPPLLWITCRRNPEPSDAETISIPLGELSDEESRTLAASLMRADSERSLAIARESRGNPLFLNELARYTAGAGQHARMQQAIEARIAGLPQPARRVLEVAAVAGRPVPRDIARGAADVGPYETGAMTQLRNARLLRTRSIEGSHDIEIYHDRIRSSVIAQILPDQVRHHHLRLAEAMERSGRFDPETLVVHFQGAGDRVRTAQYAIAAGEQSTSTLAFHSAAGFYRLALGTGVLDPARTAQLRVALADSLVNAGLGAEAAEVYRTAAAEQHDAATQIDLLRRAGFQHLLSGHPAPGLELIREVLKRVGLPLPSDPRRTLLRLLWRRIRIVLRGYEFREKDAGELNRRELLRVDTCWSAAQGLAMIDMFQAAAFQGLHLSLALRAGEPYRVGRAFCIEAGYFALAGPAGDAKCRALLARASAISMRLNHPHLTGLVSLVTGMAAFLSGRWKESREALERAEETLQHKCVGVAWELATARLMHCVSLFFLGEFRELANRLPGMLENAELRGDVYESTDLRIRISHAHLLTLGRTREAADEVKRAIANWPQDRFYLQHWWNLIASVEIWLYANEPERAWQTIERSWSSLRRSLFLIGVQYIRVESLYHRACAALSLGTASGIRRASRDAVRLDHENTPWVEPLAQSVHAGVAAARGRLADAGELLVCAETGFRAAHMTMFAAAALRCRGELLGDAHGRELTEAADRLMREQGVADPAAMAAMLVPVYRSRVV